LENKELTYKNILAVYLEVAENFKTIHDNQKNSAKVN